MANTHRAFVSFAVEDATYRDLLVGQAKNTRSPFGFVDMSVKQPWDSSWKANCLTKIRGCDALIALVSRNTLKADGARWEIDAAKKERIPILGIWIHSDDHVKVPELEGVRVIPWTWEGITKFLSGL